VKRALRRALTAVSLLALALPADAFAKEKEKFDPAKEFVLDPWIKIPALHLGPVTIDLSITKAVAYLILGAVITIVVGIVLMRLRLRQDPTRRQTVGETIYDLAQNEIAAQGLPTKAMGRWFPYVASLFLFVFVVNFIGFIPLPLTGETFELFGVKLPTLGIYAATSALSVTLALALMTIFFTHAEGIRWNGARRYFAGWLPGGMPKLSVVWAIPLAALYALEVLSQAMRIVSLSVRLYANMLAGHMLILALLGLIFAISSVLVGITVIPFVILLTTLIYIFEICIVVSIQAFIFAILSATYIGSAIEPEH
jgi:F-type H+-transporting ATPase subunit a